MHSIVKILALINYWFENKGRAFKKGQDNKPQLSMVSRMMMHNINNCDEYHQLEACDTLFREKLIEYKNDPSIEAFKKVIISQMQIQRVTIQIQQAKLLRKL